MSTERRFSELDALRGLAVLSMILYHLFFDLAFFYGWDIPVREGIYSIWARGTAMIFLGVIGVCFVISWNRSTSGTGNTSFCVPDSEFLAMYPKYLRRGLTIFLGGMVIYFVTYLIAPGAAVKFGILHLIGASAMLQPLFARFGVWNAVIGIAWTAVGIKLATLRTESVLLFPFGIMYPEFYSLDYYPLFPWFGTVLMGMAVGNVLYVPARHHVLEHIARFPIPIPRSAKRIAEWMGRRALPLYFVHQPILLMILVLMLGRPMI